MKHGLRSKISILRGNSIPAERNLEMFAHIERTLSNSNHFSEESANTLEWKSIDDRTLEGSNFYNDLLS